MDYSFVETYIRQARLLRNKKARAQKARDQQAKATPLTAHADTAPTLAAVPPPSTPTTQTTSAQASIQTETSNTTTPQSFATPATQAQLPSVPQQTPKSEDKEKPAATVPSFLQKDEDLAVNVHSLPKNDATKTTKKKSGLGGNITSIVGNRLFLMTIIAVGLVTLAILALSLYTKGRPRILGRQGGQTQQPQENARQQVLGNEQELADQYLKEVGKIIALPKDEKPLGVASITDHNKLQQDQPFFNNAKNGDVIIIYSSRAILYDPNNKVIVDIAPVNVEKEQLPQATTSSASPSP